MAWWIYILIIGIILLAGGAYYLLIYNAKKKIIAIHDATNSEITLILPEILTSNKTVTSTPAIAGVNVVNWIGTPIISIKGMAANTLYTFSISGYENSNPIYIGTSPVTPPTFTLTKTDTSVTITHPIIANTTSYQFAILPFYNPNQNTLTNPFTYNASSQTSNIITFSNITPYRYICVAQATNATSTSYPLPKMISIPLIISNPIIAVCDVNNYNQVYLYFKKDIDNPNPSVTSIPSLPNNSSIIDSTIDNALVIGSLTLNVLYQFSITGITGTSNSLYIGQGNLASANVTPVITKVSANSFTASIPAVTGATSYQFIVYDYNFLGMNNMGYLYSAVSQSTSTMTYSNVPNGTYKVTIQASSSLGTKVAISGNITIPQP